MMNDTIEIDAVDVIYNGPKSDHILRSKVLKAPNQRLFHSYGPVSKGDRIQVDRRDVLANPALFLAPSGEPFKIVGKDLIDPGAGLEEPQIFDGAGDILEINEPIALDKMLERLEGIKGIGAASAAKLIKAGVRTRGALLQLGDDELAEIIGKWTAEKFIGYKEKGEV